MADADRCFRQFCFWLTDLLELDDQVDEDWHQKLGNSQRCSYLERHLLKALGMPLVISRDEVEWMFDTDCRSDFFEHIAKLAQ